MLHRSNHRAGAGLRRVLTCAVLSLVLGACSEGPAAVDDAAKVELNFLTPATVRSVAVEVSGPGISPSVLLNLPVGTDSTARGTLTLTAGGGRRFVITAFDTAGVATHRADTTITLSAGSNAPLTVRVSPLASSLGITVTFGGARVSVTDTSTRTLQQGDSALIVATALRANGTVLPSDSLEWGSSNPGIVSVARGVVRALRPGEATVTVSARGASARVRVVVLPGPANPDLVQWSTAAGGNGHWYEVVFGAFLYTEAQAIAASRRHLGYQAYLVSITSEAENTFVHLLVRAREEARSTPAQRGAYTIGGRQTRGGPGYSEPNGGWAWTSGEAFSYVAWRVAEPNNSESFEDVIYIGTGDLAPGATRWTSWNDYREDRTINGLVLEYGPPSLETGR